MGVQENKSFALEVRKPSRVERVKGFFSRMFSRGQRVDRSDIAARKPPQGRWVVKSVGDVLDLSGGDPAWATAGSGGLGFGGKPPTAQLVASVWVYACASLIARSIASVPLRVMIGDEQAPADDPLVRLLARPSEGWSYNQFAQASTYYLLLTGTAYWQKIRGEAFGLSESHPDRGKPIELWAYGEDGYSTETQDTGRPIVQYYTDKDGNQQEPADVARCLLVAPGENLEDRGLPVTAAAGGEIQTDAAAAAWQCSSMQNRAIPDGIFSLLEFTTDEQYDAIEERLTDAWMGALNAHKPMVLGQEVRWIDLAKSAVEMDFINGRLHSRESICAGFGVSPLLVGDLSRSSYSNMREARALLWDHTVLPTLDIFLDVLNTDVAKEFGEDYRVEADLSKVDALMLQLSQRVDVADKLWKMGVPMEQLNSRFRLGLEPYEGWDIGLVPGNLVPADTFGDGGEVG